MPNDADVAIQAINPDLEMQYKQALARHKALEARINRFQVLGEQAQGEIAKLETASQQRFGVPVADLPALVARLVPETEAKMNLFITQIDDAEAQMAELDAQYQSLTNGG